MISNWFDLYFPLFQFDDNDYETKEVQIKLVWNHFDRKFVLTYNMHMKLDVLYVDHNLF